MAALIFRFADAGGQISLDNFLILMARLMKLFSKNTSLFVLFLLEVMYATRICCNWCWTFGWDCLML